MLVLEGSAGQDHAARLALVMAISVSSSKVGRLRRALTLGWGEVTSGRTGLSGRRRYCSHQCSANPPITTTTRSPGSDWTNWCRYGSASVPSRAAGVAAVVAGDVPGHGVPVDEAVPVQAGQVAEPPEPLRGLVIVVRADDSAAVPGCCCRAGGFVQEQDPAGRSGRMSAGPTRPPCRLFGFDTPCEFINSLRREPVQVTDAIEQRHSRTHAGSY